MAGTAADRPVLLRLSPNGRLDRTFGGDGVVEVPVRLEGASLSRVQVLSGGTILAAGSGGRSS